MVIAGDTIKLILGLAAAVLGLLGAILGFLSKPEAWRNFLEPLWMKGVRPILRVVIALATLIIPNGLIVGFLMHRISTYYFDAGSLDLVITNSRVFLSLVGWQTLLVSLYSLLWTILVYPRVRRWFISEKSDSQALT